MIGKSSAAATVRGVRGGAGRTTGSDRSPGQQVQASTGTTPVRALRAPDGDSHRERLPVPPRTPVAAERRAAVTGWERGQAADVAPRVVRRTPVPTRVVRHGSPVPEVPDLAALARLLDVDQGELAWSADVRGLERTAGDEGLRHSRWRVVERPRGVRLLAAGVAAIAAGEGFRVHPGTTRSAGSGRRQTVLGAVVNTRPTLPRPEREALRALLHNCAVSGWVSQVRDRDPAT